MKTNELHDQHVRLISRRLVMAWSAWLLISWVVCLMVSPAHTDAIYGTLSEYAERYTPAACWLLQSAVVGFGLVWPAYRLGQARRSKAAVRTFRDMICILLVLQVVIWPMRMLMMWTLSQTLVLQLAFLVWVMTIGLWVYIGCRGAGAGRRILAMILCAITLFGGPMWSSVFSQVEAVQWSPLGMIWTISRAIGDSDIDMAIYQLTVIALSLAIAWVIALVLGWCFSVNTESNGVKSDN